MHDRNSGHPQDNDPNSAYQQQVKFAVHQGSVPAIRSFVDKHMVTLNSATVPQYLDYAKHAEKVMKEKKAALHPVFMVEDTLWYQPRYGNGQRGRGRGRTRGRGRDKWNEIKCYRCGKMGHWACDCTLPDIEA